MTKNKINSFSDENEAANSEQVRAFVICPYLRERGGLRPFLEERKPLEERTLLEKRICAQEKTSEEKTFRENVLAKTSKTNTIKTKEAKEITGEAGNFSSYSAFSSSFFSGRSVLARMEEARGLAQAIELEVVEAMVVPLRQIMPSAYLGGGKIAEIAIKVEEQAIDLVVMDCALSPVQQRNLEQALKTKVIDRTGLILEIFGKRASTAEGRLQVELAHLAYQKSRLVRSWTHLERQRGGFGFLGGPGETQIETDRRLIQERMKRIEKDLEDVKRTRALQRVQRDKVPYPTLALVGYTNAGKSTLFNRLTDASVVAKDMLFATLDPTTRMITLPHGLKVVLSDTVGFISDLPTQLIAAFRATLEGVIHAQMILHVRDIASEDTNAQSADVKAVLEELGVQEFRMQEFGAKEGVETPILEIWNKIDALPAEEQERYHHLSQHRKENPPILLSAQTGEGVAELLTRIEQILAADRLIYKLSLAAEEGADLAWIYAHHEVLTREEGEGGEKIELRLRIAKERQGQFQHRFPHARREQAAFMR